MTTERTVEENHLIEGPEDAPVLVLSNSLGTTLAMWDEQEPALNERFRLLRYDHRGHGGSPVPLGPYKIEDLGRDVLALLDRLELERFSFCGFSIGGIVGMWFADVALKRVERLMLCRTSARFPPATFDSRARTVRANGVNAIADAVVEQLVHPRLPPGSPRCRRVGPAYAARHSRRGPRGLLRGGQGC